MGSSSSRIEHLDERDPRAVIFFGLSTAAELEVSGDSQARDFIRVGHAGNRVGVRCVSIADRRIWISEPAGEVVDGAIEHGPEGAEERPKFMPLKMLYRGDLLSIPPILAGARSSTYLSLGTFRPFSHWGCVKAIERVLGLDIPEDHYDKENLTSAQLLECLSSLQLETLVARVFEEAGAFVPARSGGTVIDADIMPENHSGDIIRLGKLVMKPGQQFFIQVKGWSTDGNRRPTT